jgi:uncharacterized protein YecT (DUF1311 family)
MLIALCQSDTALAQRTQQNAESPAFKRCMAASGGVTSKMRACLHAEYDRLDKELNLTYRSVMKQLNTKQLRERLVGSGSGVETSTVSLKLMVQEQRAARPVI